MSEVVIEEKHDSLVLLGLSSTRAVFSCSPDKPVIDIVEPVSESLYDTYILLEEWGLWTAAVSVVQGVGTVREKATFFIDDDLALEIDRLIAQWKKRDPDGGLSFDVLHCLYAQRLSYRKVSKVTGVSRVLINGVRDRYAVWLASKVFELDNKHVKNIRRVFNLRGENA